MHFTYQVLNPYTKLGWHAFHFSSAARATHEVVDCCLCIGIIDKHHPPPGGVEVSRTTLPAHGLVWLGSTRMAVGPAAAGDPSFVWHHVAAVLNAATPSLEE